MMFKRQARRKQISLEDIRLDKLPALSSDELLDVLGLHNRIRNIQRIVGIDAERFELLYLQPLHQFIDIAQLAPASTDYHHTAPGGLILHTTGMIELALHERRKHELPLRSDPEVQQKQKHLWTYAVFVGALLHDIGKLITLCRFHTGTGLYNPYSTHKIKDQCEYYSLVFQKAPYSLHQRLSGTFYQIIPPVGQAFISDNLVVLEQLMGFFNDSPYDWGSIGEIIRQADQQSVANDLKLGTRRRFPQAPSSPLHERLMTSLRQIIRQGGLPVNRPGAALWVKSGVAYLVSKVGADAMREFLKEHGATDIPVDNLRLFDALQQFGLVMSTPEGRAIWRVQINLPEGFSQSFTVLKFETRRLFHPSNIPTDLQGVINETEVSLDELEEPVAVTQGGPEKESGVSVEQSSPELAQKSAQEENPAVNLKQKLPDIPKSTDNQAAMVKSEPSKEMGEAFIAWLRERIMNRKITLNQDLVHILNYKNHEGEIVSVAGVISPKSFDQFASDHGIAGGKPYEIVQKSVHKLKLAIKNGKFHIHKYRIKSSPSAKAILQFYVFELATLVPDDLDIKVNESLVFVPSHS